MVTRTKNHQNGLQCRGLRFLTNFPAIAGALLCYVGPTYRSSTTAQVLQRKLADELLQPLALLGCALPTWASEQPIPSIAWGVQFQLS